MSTFNSRCKRSGHKLITKHAYGVFAFDVIAPILVSPWDTNMHYMAAMAFVI